MADIKAVLRLLEAIAAKHGADIKPTTLEHKSLNVPPLAPKSFEERSGVLVPKPGEAVVSLDEKNLKNLPLDAVDSVLARTDAALSEQPLGTGNPLLQAPTARTGSGQEFVVGEVGPEADQLKQRFIANLREATQNQGGRTIPLDAKDVIRDTGSSTNFAQARNLIKQQMESGGEFAPSDLLQELLQELAMDPVNKFNTIGPGSSRTIGNNAKMAEMLRLGTLHGPNAPGQARNPLNMRSVRDIAPEELDPKLDALINAADASRGKHEPVKLTDPVVSNRRFDEQQNIINDRDGQIASADAEIAARSSPVDVREVVKESRKKRAGTSTQDLERALLGADLSPAPITKLPEEPRVDPLAQKQAPVMREKSIAANPKLEVQRERVILAAQALKNAQSGKITASKRDISALKNDVGRERNILHKLERGENVDIVPSEPQKMSAPENLTPLQRQQKNRDRIARKMLEREQRDQLRLGF